MKTISLTIPMDYNALTRASDMLHVMAIDLSKEQPAVNNDRSGRADGLNNEGDLVDNSSLPRSSEKVDVLTKTQATEVFSPKLIPEPAQTAAAPTTAQPAETTASPAPGAGIELDSDGLPWDHRIHSLAADGAHNKLKKTGQWKKKRGVDAALVSEVEAELKAAMAAGPANPVRNAAATTASPAVAPTTAAAAVQPASPAPAPVVRHGTVDTFPELMAAITANGIDQATVTAAVNTQGLVSLPLLAARPDLIPAVAKVLGV